MYAGPKCWNNLSDKIKQLPVNGFKVSLIEFLKQDKANSLIMQFNVLQSKVMHIW